MNNIIVNQITDKINGYNFAENGKMSKFAVRNIR